MRDAKEAKAAKKYKKKAKAIQLKTQGEILREKAVKRRSQWNSDGVHNSALPDENSAAEANVSSTSSKQKSTKMTRVDASMGAYLELQMLNRKEDNTFLQHQIELKKRKIENEATRWAQEFQLKQAQQALDQKKWNDDVDLRRKEMQLRREELALMRLQFDSQRK
ncbi:hypothetical protein PHYBOEH_001567 [Phytophthora boehmeriae]|uniref:No apical meristem-associated C-terminal domain-containing protein n=1 Tax=Phytophthora boehmeriae TaxID=109152 RepID=A0A8T1V8E8_9STRA|nr:hypothetical protein PHYBOEH_001567 [Phytophthora boehmeriae]